MTPKNNKTASGTAGGDEREGKRELKAHFHYTAPAARGQTRLVTSNWYVETAHVIEYTTNDEWVEDFFVWIKVHAALFRGEDVSNDSRAT